MYLKRGIKNILFGFLSQAVSIILGVVLPRLFITSLGSETNGLIASVSQVFVYIGLFEAGVGTASLVALYGPVAAGDKYAINGILSAANCCYKKSGLWYLGAILVFAAVYPLIIPSDISKTAIAVVILLTGIPGMLSFFLQEKYCLLLRAEGKEYIITNLAILVNILTNISRIVLLKNGFDIIAVQSAYTLFNLVQIFCIQVYIKKKYGWIDIKTEPDMRAVSSKGSVLVHNISFLVFNNTDIIILSVFCDLKLVSVYTVYSLLFNVVKYALESVLKGFNFSLGQVFNTDRDKYLKMNDAFETYYMALVFALCGISFVFILPFLQLYTSGVTDINYIDRFLPYLFVSVFLLTNARAAPNMAISFAGHFRQTKWRSILESGINLCISLVLVYFIGIHGVLIGTAAALLYRTNDMIIYASRKIWGRSPWITYRRCLVNLFLLIILVIISKLIPMDTGSYVKIGLWAAVFCIAAIPVFFAVNLIFEKEVRISSAAFIKHFFFKKIRSG
ncbi:MAG: lipopolysaccharide biosynthesis protein [Oscillospiraceae bacterium]|jgi:O-antigen/teichoic acid export membrane protein